MITDGKCTIKYFVVPGGQHFRVGRNGDTGIDAMASAVIAVEKKGGRRCLWNFVNRRSAAEEIQDRIAHNDELGVYTLLLGPGESVALELGIIFGGDDDWYAELKPRSSGANRRISVKNFFDNVPIDSNFRKPPVGLYKNEGMNVIPITMGWSVSQFVFFCKCCNGSFIKPDLIEVQSVNELGHTSRGDSWNGSSNPQHFQRELALHS